jgi:hypothetical protein
MNEQTALTVSERSILERHESVINEGLQTFAEVGNALLAIRDGKLYRAEHGTFEGYCKERWGFSRIHAHRMIDAARVCETLPMGNKPQSERQARPLASLPAADQPAAWQAATEKAKAEDRPVTARDVQAEVDKVKQAAIESERTVDPVDVETKNASKLAEVYTSETMAGLKRYWKQATKKERAAFIKWTETYEN